MISVANFYWVLYETLLRPADFQARYFYPFGTTQYLIEHEFHPCIDPKHNAHVLFHYDQEPLYEDANDVILSAHSTSRFRSPMILANSEQSVLKKKICKDLTMLDWYFFYHGFAALDWYGDARYIDYDQDLTNHFCCLNRNTKGNRVYRMAFTARLCDRNLVRFGSLSLHCTADDCWHELDNLHTQLSDQDRLVIEKTLLDNVQLPLQADHAMVSSDFSANFGIGEYRFWQKSFLHLVTETIFYDQKLHLTEKIFRPIVSQRPFILVGAPDNLAYLKSYGFKTFDKWIDESYDSVTDTDLRLNLITDAVEKICALSLSDLRSMLADMQEVLKFNKRHFFGEFRDIIVNELVDNFDQCIRLWNNGRIDRFQPRHPDLALAKQVLLR